MISVRVDEELQEKMRRYPKINWSQQIRETIEKRIQQEEMRQAAQTMDKIAEKTDPQWSGSDEVQRWQRRDEPENRR
jgi:hypothetical protein